MRFATSLWILLVLSWSQRLDAADDHHFSLSLQKPSAMISLILFMLVVPGTYQVTENHLAPIVADLSTVARLINSISLQSDFMHTSQNLNPVLAEFLNIGDPNAIPELLNIKASALSTDVQGLLDAVQTVHASTTPIGVGIEDAVELMKSVDLEEIKKAIQFDIQPMKEKWRDASDRRSDFTELLYSDAFVKGVEDLNYVITTNYNNTDDGYGEMRNTLIALQDGSAEIGNVFYRLKNSAKFDPIWVVIGTEQLFEKASQIAKLSEEYSDIFPSFVSLSQLFLHMKTSVTEMDLVFKKSQQISIDNKTLEAIRSTVSPPTDKNRTAGLPNGVADLKTLFDDLDGEWLKDQFKGKDMKMLVTALEPLKKFYETLEPVEASWNELKKSPEAQQVVESVSNLLQYGKLLKQDDLIGNADTSSQCVSGLKDTSDPRFYTQFNYFYEGLNDLNKALTKVKGIVQTFAKSKHVEVISNFERDTFMLQTGGVSRDAAQSDIDKVKNYADITEISQLLNDYVAKMKTINFEQISKTLSLYTTGFRIQEKLSETGLVSAIECLKNGTIDIVTTEAFFKFKRGFETLKPSKEPEATWKRFTSAVQTLQSSENELKETVDGMKVSSRRRRRAAETTGLLKLSNSNQLARDLGNGVQVLREINEVFEHQDRVKQVARSSAEVDRAIRSIPKMDTMWTVENKKGLEKLVKEVNTLNQKAGLEKNRSLETTWKLFEDGQDVYGAPVDARLLANPIYGVLNNTIDPDARAGAAVFKDFPPLQLEFASKPHEHLREASIILPSIESLIVDFIAFKPETTTTTTTEPSETPWLWIGIGIGAGVLVIVGLVGGYFAYRHWKKKNGGH